MYKILHIPTGSFIQLAIPRNKAFNAFPYIGKTYKMSIFWDFSIADYESPENAWDALEEFINISKEHASYEEFEVIYV